MADGETRVVVLGEVFWQEVLLADTNRGSGHTRHQRWIGAPLIREMVAAALQSDEKHKAAATVAQPSEPAPPNFAPDYANLDCSASDNTAKYDSWDALLEICGQFSATLAPYPPKSRSEKKRDPVLRVASDLRATNASSRVGAKAKTEALFDEWIKAAQPKGRRLFVIYDRGSFLQRYQSEIQRLLEDIGQDEALVFAFEGEIGNDNGDVRPELLSVLRSIKPEVRDRVTVLLPASSLRTFGMELVEYGHVEQAVRDVAGHLDKEPLQSFSTAARHIVVTTQEAAVLHFNVSMSCGWTPTSSCGSIHMCPNWDRLAHGDPTGYGTMPGKLWIVLTSLVKLIFHEMRGNMEAAEKWDLAPALRLGLVAFNRYFGGGFDAVHPFAAITDVLAPPSRTDLKSLVDKGDREFLITSLDFQFDKLADAKAWNRIDNALVPKRHKTVEAAVRQIVKFGVDAAFRQEHFLEEGVKAADTKPYPWFPGYWIACPYAEFGDVKLVAESEVASYVALSKLIDKYLTDKARSKPFSIAVFGAPGSGKSFAVKEIIKSVSPSEPDREPLTFNLAQFSSVEQLTDAFHMVQDRVLSSSAIPLVIFDEFDCFFEGTPLGWLKYFLAPMQDGQFHGRSNDYRIGRAIFLFSGGTAEKYDQFHEKLEADPEMRKQVKLSDFLSRLRGHLDVAGLNDADGGGATTTLLKVRRAALLRSILERDAKPIFRSRGRNAAMVAQIQDQVIDLFVNQWRYVHGVRSIEAVIQMSRWIDGRYVLSSLPDKSQLNTHIALAEPKPSGEA